MNSDSPRLWEADPKWRERLIAASRHRDRAHLIEAGAFTGFDPRHTPKNQSEWQLTLFAALASGMADLAEHALKAGANPTAPAVTTWLGASDGKMVPTTTMEAAYHWLYSFRWELILDWTPVTTPIEAGVAGACPKCIEMVIQTGDDFERAIIWLRHLRFNIPRVWSSLALFECIASSPEKQKFKAATKSWIGDIEKWLRIRCKRMREDRTERETVVRAYRQLIRVAQSFDRDINPSNTMLAELL